MMKTIVFLTFLWLRASVSEAHSETPCNHNLHCPDLECCVNLGVFPTDYKGETRWGNCFAYKKDGEICETFSSFICGCPPSLECGLVEENSTDSQNLKKCKKSSTPEVEFERNSEALCDRDSECPVKDECCVATHPIVPGFYTYGDDRKGNCRKFIKEGRACTPRDNFGCGCVSGLECVFQESTQDGAAPERICKKAT